MAILMLYNKTEVNKSEHFTPRIEIEINQSDCFTQTSASRKKNLQSIVRTKIYTRFRYFIAFLLARKW